MLERSDKGDKNREYIPKEDAHRTGATANLVYTKVQGTWYQRMWKGSMARYAPGGCLETNVCTARKQ